MEQSRTVKYKSQRQNASFRILENLIHCNNSLVDQELIVIGCRAVATFVGLWEYIPNEGSLKSEKNGWLSIRTAGYTQCIQSFVKMAPSLPLAPFPNILR